MVDAIKLPAQFFVHPAPWASDGPLLRAVRNTVFVHEQGVPVELEWDGLDAACYHVLALDVQGDAIGCGRITADAHIGRMAVVPAWRGRKVGTMMLDALLEYARGQGFEQVELNAQVRALSFYQRLGFREIGGEFMEAGILHRKMYLRF